MGLLVLLMAEEEAMALRAATAAGESRLEPRLVAAGPLAGSHVLPERVAHDPAFAGLGDAFAAMAQAELDPAEAWPPDDAAD